MLERRNRPRIAMRLVVNMFALHAAGLTDLASTENLSIRGARVVTKYTWELGSHLVINAISGDMSTRARVVYCHPVAKKFAVGLDFLTQFKNS